MQTKARVLGVCFAVGITICAIEAALIHAMDGFTPHPQYLEEQAQRANNQ